MKQNLLRRHLNLKKRGKLKTIKLKFVRYTSKADQIITHRLLKRSASKFFERDMHIYPREAKDLNLLLNKRKHAKITQKMDKDKKQFKSFF